MDVSSADIVGGLNRVTRRALRRADELEDKLARILEPILERAGERAASAFEERAQAYVRASLAAAASTPASAMVALYPRPEEAEAVAEAGGEPPAIMHVTLCYLGDIAEDALSAIREALAPVAANFAPLEGAVAGVATFGRGDDGYPAIVLPSVPGLVELRVEVTEALFQAGIDYSREYGFVPHMTVAYRDEPRPPSPALVGQPLHFDGLVLTQGDVPEAIPLVGTPAVTAATAPPPWRPPAGAELLDLDALIAELRTKTDPVRLALIAALMDDALGPLGIKWDVTNAYIAKALASSGLQVTGIADTTRLNVMRIIRRAYHEGLSIPDTAKLIRVGMREASPARALLIAQTELVGAVNGGSLAATKIVAKATGDRYWKRWLTAPGARHPRHNTYDGLNGQTRHLDGYFDVGGSQLEHPGDPNGPPHEVCRCRCAIDYTDEAPI